MSPASRSGSGARPGGRGTKARAARLGQAEPDAAESTEADDLATPDEPARSTVGTTTAGRPAARTSKASTRKASTRKASDGRADTAPRAARDDLDPERRAALVEERDFLLASLRDLEAEHEAGDVDDRDYVALEDDYTARAAAAIRALDGQAPKGRRRAEAARPRSRLVIAAVVAVLAVGAGVLVAQWSGSRTSSDSITGGIRSDSRDELVQARQDAADQNYLQAIKDYDQVLKDDPANTEALAYKGWMLRIVALSASGTQQSQLRAEALASLQQALRTSPTDGTSLVFTAVLLGDLGKPSEALDTLAKVPPGGVPSAMSSTIDQFKAQMQAQLGSASSSSTASTTSTTAG